jgi:hypothetical protein
VNYFDATRVLALADLFTYVNHDLTMDDAPNWLAAFLYDILVEVAVYGPEWANAHPEFVKKKL